MNCQDVAVKQEKKLKFRPIGDRILVRVRQEAETVVNGILIPDNAVERPLLGEVVAVGNGIVKDGERIPLDIKVGDVIAFGKYCGNEVKVSGEALLLLIESEVQGCYYQD
jgi:chaperonin GroES